MPIVYAQLKSKDKRTCERLAKMAGYGNGGFEIFEEFKEMILGNDAVTWKEIAAVIGMSHPASARKLCDNEPTLARIVRRPGRGKTVRANVADLVTWASIHFGR